MFKSHVWLGDASVETGMSRDACTLHVYEMLTYHGVPYTGYICLQINPQIIAGTLLSSHYKLHTELPSLQAVFQSPKKI